MMEAGVVLDLKGNALHWHLPENRSVGALPDSRSLWDVIWENRDNISGFAHSHPGWGLTGPSYTDVTTFKAIEQALGKELDWFICSGNTMIVAKYSGPGRHEYQCVQITQQPPWLKALREKSNYYRGKDNG